MTQAPPVGDKDPWSEEHEISVLGAMLIDEEARAEALERLEPADFYQESNARIFDAFRRLNGRGKAADITQLTDELKSAGDLKSVGGMPYVAQLVDAVATGENVDQHAERLRELRALRELRNVASDALVTAGSVPPGEAADLLTSFSERLRDVQTRAGADNDVGLRTAREILEDPDARNRPAPVADRLAWEELVTMLAGREKAGKSTLLRFAVARVTTGRHVWTGEPTAAGPREVVYWAEERDEDVARDLQRMGADIDRVHVRDMRLILGDRFAALRRDLDRTEPALLVVDTLASFTDNMDLESGDPGDWSPVMNRFGALAQELTLAVLLNHHARKIDGEYRGSTAIGAGVDAILEFRRDPQEGERVRKVTAKARAAAEARDFSYELVDTDGSPRLELLDGSLSLEERIQRFVRRHEGCGQRQVIDGVRGRGADVRETLKELCEDGGPLVEDDTTTPYEYHTRQNPRGNGPETVGKRLGNGSTGREAGSVSEDVGGGHKSPPHPETQAEPVEKDEP